MDNQNNIQDELNAMNSGLPVDNNKMLFAVPEGYFDGLAASVLERIKAKDASAVSELQELSPLLASISREMPFYLPESYFDENLSLLPNLLQETEPSVLAGIGKNLPYTVPQDYFENLPHQVVAKVSPHEGKVVPLFARKWMRAAVAAVVGGAVFIAGYQLLNGDSDDQDQAGIQQPVNTTKNFVAKNEPTVVQDIKRMSIKELDEFIKSVPVNPAKLQAAPAESDDVEIKNLLQGISKKEIDAFLEQTPTADDDLAIID